MKTALCEKLMRICHKKAKLSHGKNLPNPYVGALLFDEENRRIISFGYHHKFGSSHAEVEAIANAKGNTEGKTLFVNLEPCCHWGKTPPCCDLIIKSKIKNVYISTLDPNPLVAGVGKKKLEEAGIKVFCGILEKEALELNKIFFKNMIYKKPYVMLKTATTLDSKIALENGSSKWITNEKAREEVQKLRSSYQAIMTGSGTVLSDNPRLDVRCENKKSPVRIIFDPNNKIPFDMNVFKKDNVRIILVNNADVKPPLHVEKIDFSTFDDLFKTLYKNGIYSIMLEAGAGLNSQLLKNAEVDEINQFVAPKIFACGKSFVDGIVIDKIDDCIELENIKIKKIEDNFLINGRIKRRNHENSCY